MWVFLSHLQRWSLCSWEGLKLPQTQREGWLVSWVEVGEKYSPVLTNVSVSCLWLNIGKRCLGGGSGAPIAVWMMKVGRNPHAGAVEHRALLPRAAMDGAFLG